MPQLTLSGHIPRASELSMSWSSLLYCSITHAHTNLSLFITDSVHTYSQSAYVLGLTINIPYHLHGDSLTVRIQLRDLRARGCFPPCFTLSAALVQFCGVRSFQMQKKNTTRGVL